MDSFELNKIIGAILGTLLFVMGVGFLAEAIYHPIEGRGPGYALPEPEVDGAAAKRRRRRSGGAARHAAGQRRRRRRAQASAKKCQSCHNFDAGRAEQDGSAPL